MKNMHISLIMCVGFFVFFKYRGIQNLAFLAAVLFAGRGKPKSYTALFIVQVISLFLTPRMGRIYIQVQKHTNKSKELAS